MGLWDKSLRIFKHFCDHGTQSVRRIAQQTGLSTSSVQRLTPAMARRGGYPESWVWETAEGRAWLIRLMVATLYTFGLTRGVGVETLRTFFTRRHLDTQMGCSPGALRQVIDVLEATSVATAEAWEREAVAAGEVRELIGGVDETFLERMLLVFHDLPTGYLLLEEVADDRTFATWNAVVEARLTALGTEGLYLVSDRAKALIQLAEHGLECLSMPDFFHCMHDLVQSYAFVIGQRVRHAQQELTKAQAILARLLERPHAESTAAAAQAGVEAKHIEVRRWDEVHTTYRTHLETLSLTLHPFRLVDSTPHTSAQVTRQLQETVAAIETLLQDHQLPARPEAMAKVRKQLPALAALVDVWWQGVERAVEPFRRSSTWRQWVHECLLPLVYWEHHGAHTRCARRKAKLRQAMEVVATRFHTHAISKPLAPQVLEEWQAWAVQRIKTFQRTSSAVEGRNGYLSQMQHNQRGLPKHSYKVWTILHNCDGRAADGTTPAGRFFRRTVPDLFETVVSHIEVLPQPRRRKHEVALGP
jgi:hypothetical protein